MFSGFYSAASGMLMNQRRLNMISNNMANQNTPGYQARKLVGTTFEDELVRQQNGQNTQIGKGTPISIVAEEAIDFTAGSYDTTNRSFDAAIYGNGFFTVQDGDTAYLTRNGNFDRDTEGYLILPGVGRVAGSQGPVQVGGGNFSIGPTGAVYNADGNMIDLLQIVEPADYNNLEVNNNGMYTVTDGQTNRVYPRIQQGVLEKSNVNVSKEMTDAMDVQRAFQSCGKALSIIDQMNQKTASEIGKL